MGYAFILYSVDQEAFMHYSAGSERTSSALHAESKALLKDLKWLEGKLLSSVTFVTDCKPLADTINNKEAKTEWIVENTMKKIFLLFRIFHKPRLNIFAGTIMQQQTLLQRKRGSEEYNKRQ